MYSPARNTGTGSPLIALNIIEVFRSEARTTEDTQRSKQTKHRFENEY